MSKVYIQKFCKAKLFLSICRNFGRKQTKNITKEFTGKETKSLNSIWRGILTNQYSEKCKSNQKEVSFFFNLIYKFNAISVKIPESYFFLGYWQTNSKFIGRSKRPRIGNSILKKKNKVRKLPQIKTYSKSTAIETA